MTGQSLFSLIMCYHIFQGLSIWKCKTPSNSFAIRNGRAELLQQGYFTAGIVLAVCFRGYPYLMFENFTKVAAASKAGFQGNV